MCHANRRDLKPKVLQEVKGDHKNLTVGGGEIYTLTCYNENKYQKDRFLSFVKGGIKSGWGFMGIMTSHTVLRDVTHSPT